ncbi:MAG: DUF814 domain-containing protein [Candidatus Syntrophosphaera sp.]|nr:DUF814 domain-containing protein [Candidatus Syntrophosphaera sp.]
MNYTILRAWTSEHGLLGSRVESVHSFDAGIRVRFKNKRDLLLIASSRDSFPFWTDNFVSAKTESSIWNQLTHATLSSVRIAENDRIIQFAFEQNDIYQQRVQYVLIAEFTPPKPNLILAVQNSELIIVDALNKYSYADNPQRQVLPRLPYQAPHTTFQPRVENISLPLSVEAAKGGEKIVCDTVNDYLRNYHEHVLLAGAELQALKSIRAHWTKELNKARHKLAKQQDEIKDADQAEYWRICAETLKTGLTSIKKGQTSLIATNYFDPALASIEIPLQADKSPQQNLQFYLKKYHKAKRGAEVIRENISQTELEIRHLENILGRVDKGELVYAPRGRYFASLGRKLDQAEKLLRLRLNEDFEIVIGRKARENDFITTQLAQPHDWWFHTRIYHGSHILLRCFKKTAPGPDLIKICCSLAAWYSKARFSQNVPVDYTQARHVRKPRKSAPGFVTYTNHHTVFADPKDLRAVREELKP